MQQVHFIGIGGIGMSALASIMLAKGHQISGSDAGGENSLTIDLSAKGAQIFYEHKSSNISETCDTIIYTEAIPSNNPELIEAEKRGIYKMTYAQALGEISKRYNLLVISGTHGKTTVTGMLSKIAIDAELDPTIVIGSKMKDLDGKNFRIGSSNIFIIEGCEYRRSFLNFKPNILGITNLEVDHLDYYKDEEDYLNAFESLILELPKSGNLIVRTQEAKKLKLQEYAKCQITKFDASEIESLGLNLKAPGKHNRLNALTALKLAEALGVEKEAAIESLNNFSGTWRRFEYIGKNGDTEIYDDYAHHPTEIRASLQAAREKYPDAKICAVFQPHQFSRTKHFLNEFGKSFKDADEVLIPSIYKVRDTEEDTKSVSAVDLVKEIQKNEMNAISSGNLEETSEFLQDNIEKWDVVLLMGAGDITKIREEL